MKMIYVGSLSPLPDRDSGWMKEFANLGWEVIPFSSEVNFTSTGIFRKVQRRFNCGPANRLMQGKLIALVEDQKPDWVHFRLPIEFNASTIRRIKRKGPIVSEYFNDDPFSSGSPSFLHNKFRRAMKYYDMHFVYRAHNITDFKTSGAKWVEHCPPTYDARRHKINRRRPDGFFMADAAFIGHWEGDWRVECLEALHNKGFDVIIRGGGWETALRSSSLKNISVTGAFGDEYNEIYSNVVAGLCFFSKINRDSWTERGLEIVAVGGLLVAERTEEAMGYFKDRHEAFFFSSVGELVEILTLLKDNPELRERVREAGYKRLLAGKNSIADRACMVSDSVHAMLQKQKEIFLENIH